jgi:hypothetical protein
MMIVIWRNNRLSNLPIHSPPPPTTTITTGLASDSLVPWLFRVVSYEKRIALEYLLKV